MVFILSKIKLLGTISHHSNIPINEYNITFDSSDPNGQSDRAAKHADISCSPCDIDRGFDSDDNSIDFNICPQDILILRIHCCCCWCCRCCCCSSLPALLDEPDEPELDDGFNVSKKYWTDI